MTNGRAAAMEGDMARRSALAPALLMPMLLAAAPPTDAPAPQLPPPPRLELPLACDFGKECFIQQYPDHDTGPGAKDFRCGTLSYDTHNGTDFRLTSVAAQRRGVGVITAAPGTVRAIRNDMDDRLLPKGQAKLDAKGRECGNGVLIAHEGGWESQYCHMAKGSIAVSPGQQVKAGEALGRVGLSGNTEFPHLHLALRHQGRPVDPFAPKLADNTCGEGGGTPLWSAAAIARLPYRAGQIINAGFGSGPVTESAIDEEAVTPPDASAPAATFYARFIGVQAGDTIRLTLRAPDGTTAASHEKAIEKPMAVWFSFVGRRAPPRGWAKGAWRGEAELLRGGQPVARREASIRF